MPKNGERIQRIRNFAFLVYPESWDEYGEFDLINMLRKCGIVGYCILHDKDVKKPHYHVLVTNPNPLDYNSCLEVALKCLCANGIIQKVSSLKSYARYLCHLDDPGKYKYDIQEVVNFGGADYSTLIETETEQLDRVAEVIRYCKNNCVYSYSSLVNYCMERRRDWFKLLCNASYGRVVRDYIKSSYWDECRRR